MPVIAETFSTLAETTTTADPGTGGTTLAVTSRTAFPQKGQFRILVQDSETDKTNREIMLVTAGFGTGAGSFTVTRGATVDGTAAVAHPVGSYVAQVLTASAQQRWIPDYVVQPRHKGFLAWTFEPGPWAGATAPVQTTLVPWLFRVPIPETMTLATMHCWVVTAGATLTAGSNLGAVYLSTGVRIGTTATQATAWTTTGRKDMALTVDAGQSLTVAGGPDVFVWACLLSAGTTQPAFMRWSTTLAAFLNGLNTAANAWVGKLTAVTAGQGPPATFTPSTAITLEATMQWVGFS